MVSHPGPFLPFQCGDERCERNRHLKGLKDQACCLVGHCLFLQHRTEPFLSLSAI